MKYKTKYKKYENTKQFFRYNLQISYGEVVFDNVYALYVPI